MENLFQENIKKIYNCLEDEQSKEIFTKRLLYSLTGDCEYILDIVRKTHEGSEVYSRLKNSSKRKAIFGAGIWGKNIINAYQDIPFACFIDNKADAAKKEYYGLPVMSLPNFLAEGSDVTIVISSRLYHEEIYKQLLDAGICEEDIINAGGVIDNMSKNQYFDLPALFERRQENEIFVDGGSFDGKTAVEFVKWCNGNYAKVYAFEPDVDNRIKCEKTLRKACGDKFEVFTKGLWDAAAELHFMAIANGSSKVSSEGEQKIDVVSLDETIQDEVSFIKLDVEGSEYKAILGAQKLIRQYKPKLAISIYHKPEDIWELPMLISSLNEEYRFYLRHYSIAASETVLYAL